MAKKIEHLVVLMMENRSFDHALGFLKSPSWPIDGLTGTESNPDSTGVAVRVTPDARDAGDFFPDPGHDFLSVNEQIFSNSAGTGSPTMQGFVKAYEGKTKDVQRSHRVMKCFGPGRLPNLSTLAREYAVCDRWFASVPGPTLPNRAFSIGASSLGRVDMNPNYLTLKTVFELLDGHNVSSKIYYTDWTLGLAVRFVAERAKKFLFFFDDFVNDCKKNKLPALSFVEPRYNDLSTPGEFFGAADQHPDHNMRLGERVINAVYQAVTSNKQTWESTLLLITYDEHGGLYDHVSPPPTVNPGDKPLDATMFNFQRLGVRVPAVLVSPFIPAGTIIHDKVFDHTSIIATARKLFIPDWEKFFLTERDRHANTFDDCLTLAAPRTGKVKFPKQAPEPKSAQATFGLASFADAEGAAEASEPKDLNDFQQAMVVQAWLAESKLVPGHPTTSTPVSSITNEYLAADYLAAVRQGIAEMRQPLPSSKARGTKKSIAARKSRSKSANKATTKRSKKSAKKGKTSKSR
jgi:phospholipase C